MPSEQEQLDGDRKIREIRERDAEPDQFQYEAGEFAYSSYASFMIDITTPAFKDFRELTLKNRQAWVRMASAFKKRYVCAG